MPGAVTMVTDCSVGTGKKGQKCSRSAMTNTVHLWFRVANCFSLDNTIKVLYGPDKLGYSKHIAYLVYGLSTMFTVVWLCVRVFVMGRERLY